MFAQLNDYLRLALMFGDNQATTFKRNLEKMISLVLCDNYGHSLTIVEIMKELSEKYSLDFADNEILDVLENSRRKKVVCEKHPTDTSLDRYSIIPEEYQKIMSKVGDDTLQKKIELFLHDNPQVEIAPEDFVTMLQKFLYNVFNSNAEIMLSLIKGNSIDTSNVNAKEFEEKEKEIINAFLQWQDDEKNKCVYDLVSCCFDYCMMTVRKDKSSYNNVFRNKHFFLDANIIFRLMGINKESRKFVIDSFIRKCKSVDIELRYTNFTVKEIEDTIDYHVNKIRSIFKEHSPLEAAAVCTLSSDFCNMDFYERYVEWCKSPIHSAGDYEAFKDDLKMSAQRIMSQFKFVTVDSYEKRKNNTYCEYKDNLAEFKRRKYKFPSEGSLTADVNNYLRVLEENFNCSENDFFSKGSYLISTDHTFADWDKAMRPASIPTVVLPSVWYAIILQYSGRTNDDYASFTRFLNFSMSETGEHQDETKIRILQAVLQLNEPNDIKERTLYDIKKKLSREYKDLDSEEIVESVHKSIVEEERQKAIQETEEKAKRHLEKTLSEEKCRSQAQLEIVRTEFTSNISALSDRHENERREMKEEIERTKAQGKKEIADAKESTYKKMINQLLDEEFPKTKRLYWGITIGVLVLGIVSILAIEYVLFIYLKTLTQPIDDNFIKALEIGTPIIFAIVGYFFKSLIIDNVFCELKDEAIEEKVRKKIEKKHPAD